MYWSAGVILTLPWCCCNNSCSSILDRLSGFYWSVILVILLSAKSLHCWLYAIWWLEIGWLAGRSIPKSVVINYDQCSMRTSEGLMNLSNIFEASLMTLRDLYDCVSVDDDFLRQYQSSHLICTHSMMIIHCLINLNGVAEPRQCRIFQGPLSHFYHHDHLTMVVDQFLSLLCSTSQITFSSDMFTHFQKPHPLMLAIIH